MTRSDDPEYAATLASFLSDAGHHREAEQWRISAAARYDQLMLHHPEAFVDHATDFRLTVGGDLSAAPAVLRHHVIPATAYRPSCTGSCRPTDDSRTFDT